MRDVPMFPLGFPLMPGTVLPLYLFEERYRQLYADIVDNTREFGVVLIERGIESRDDNLTFEIGCLAKMLGSALHDDGTISIVTVGTERFRIHDWLESDPYPRARIEEVPDDRVSPSGAVALETAQRKLSRLLQLKSELDPRIEPEVGELHGDDAVATYQLTNLAGMQALDVQTVLEAPDADTRVDVLNQLLEEMIELNELQLRIR